MLQPTGLTSPINSPLDHAAGLHGSAEVVLEDVEAVRGRNLYLRPTLVESLLLLLCVGVKSLCVWSFSPARQTSLSKIPSSH